MAKYRIRTKRNSPVIVKLKLLSKEQISERELEDLLSSTIKGLFRIFYDGKKMLTYQAPPSVSLEKYLKENHLNETSFWQVTAQIIDIAIAIENRGLYPSHLFMRMDAVFIREDTLEMFFIYQPFVNEAVSAELFAFIHEIIYIERKSVGGASRNYLAAFEEFLAQGRHSLELIRQYIDDAAPWTANKSVAKQQNGMEKEYIDYDIDLVENMEQYTYAMMLDGEQEAAGEAVQKGVLLTRLRENKQTALHGSRLCLGRGMDCDYNIAGNRAVGRRHAMLEQHEDGYYLKDMGSVNGTFLNGQAVKGEKAYKLQNYDRIRLANEEFIFEIE